MTVKSPTSVLLPYQQRWIADAAPVKVMEKSRRIGISYAEAADSVLHASAAEGAYVYYISFNREMTEGFITDCATWAKAFHAGASAIGQELFPDPQRPDRSILKYSIDFASGHSVHAFSSNPRNLRSKGRPRERLVIDEAAFVDDLEELLKAALAMTMWGGEVHIISTHDGAANPFNQLILDIRAGIYDYHLHRVTLDDALQDGLYKRICQVSHQRWSAEKQASWRESLIQRYRPNEDEELFCIPRRSAGKAIPGIWIENALREVRPILRLTLDDAFQTYPEHQRFNTVSHWIETELKPLLTNLDPKREHVFGMDFARYSNLSVIAPLSIEPDLTRRAPFLIELHNVPSRQQEQILWALIEGLPRRIGGAMDAGGAGLTLAEYTADKFGRPHIQEVTLSDAWYRDHMGLFVRAFEDGQFDLPRDADLANDLRQLESLGGIIKLPKLTTADGRNKAIQRHGDAAIALALAYFASLQSVWAADWISTPPRRGDWDPAAHDDDEDRRPTRRAGGW